jgi:hypothetical protein
VDAAVVVVNTINVLICILALTGIVALPRIDQADIPDEETRTTLQSLYDLEMGIIIVVQIICQSLGICGAISFNQCLVGVSLVSYAATFITYLARLDVLGCVVTALFAYPSILFIKQVRDGIMNESTYSLEKHSCCCV